MEQKTDETIATDIQTTATIINNTDSQLTNTPCSKAGMTVDNRKRTIYDMFRSQGYTVTEAAKLAGYNRSYAYQMENKRTTGILAPLVSSAKRAIKATVKGQRVGDGTAPRASDILKAAEIILDREQPVVHQIESRSLDVKVEITAEDRERLLKALGYE